MVGWGVYASSCMWDSRDNEDEISIHQQPSSYGHPLCLPPANRIYYEPL